MIGRLDRLPAPLVVAGLILVLAAIFVPMSIFRLIDADEGIFLINAKAVLTHGEAPYHDFFYPQMPLLPYVYAAWMKVFGVSWYSGRILTGLLAVGLGLVMYQHVTATTGRRHIGVLAAGLLASNTLVLEWMTPVKTIALATFLVFAAYAMLFTRFHRWRCFFSGVLAALAVDTRIYVVVVIPLLALEIVRTEPDVRERLMQLARFAVGIAIALLPVEILVLRDPDVFLFNVLGVHGIRSPWGYVGALTQKAQLLGDVLAIYPTYAPHLQFTILLLIAIAGLWVVLRTRERLPLCAGITFTLFVVSLVPTPTYAQYLCLVVPFLIAYVVRFVTQIVDDVAAVDATGRVIRRMRAVVAVGVLVYVIPAPFDAYRYTMGGQTVPGVYERTNAHNWTIPAVKRVSRAIDETIPGAGAMTVTWWPGYLIESRAASFPRLENPYALWYSERLTPSEIVRYGFISLGELEWHIVNHTAPVAVTGNWMFTAKPYYRELLLKSGYMLAHQIGDAEIYAWREPR
jgi:hypothetical protein